MKFSLTTKWPIVSAIGETDYTTIPMRIIIPLYKEFIIASVFPFVMITVQIRCRFSQLFKQTLSIFETAK